MPYAIKCSHQMSNGPQAILDLWHLHKIITLKGSFSLHGILDQEIWCAYNYWKVKICLEARNNFVCRPQAILDLWDLHKIITLKESFSLHDILDQEIWCAYTHWKVKICLEARNSIICFISNLTPGLLDWITRKPVWPLRSRGEIQSSNLEIAKKHNNHA